MLQPPPAQPGAPVDEVDTPALLIDLDALELMRLDCGGHLCPPGWSLDDLQADDAARIARYRAARSTMTDHF